MEPKAGQSIATQESSPLLQEVQVTNCIAKRRKMRGEVRDKKVVAAGAADLAIEIDIWR